MLWILSRRSLSFALTSARSGVAPREATAQQHVNNSPNARPGSNVGVIDRTVRIAEILQILGIGNGLTTHPQARTDCPLATPRGSEKRTFDLGGWVSPRAAGGPRSRRGAAGRLDRRARRCRTGLRGPRPARPPRARVT